MSTLIIVLKYCVSWILVLISLAGSLFTGKPPAVTDNMELVSSHTYTYAKGMSFGQGIATDGKYFYGFGAVKVVGYNSITKIDAKTGKIVNMNEMCIPKELVKKGYDHLGDGCVYEGKLYIGCEDDGFKNPAVMIYDADTLDFIKYVPIPEECKGDGHLPWCTVNDGILYFCSFSFVTEIKMLDINNDFSFCGSVPIDTMLYSVQGGDIVNGILYLSTDDGEKEKPTYAVNLETGEAKIFAMRDTGCKTTEAEGLTVYPFEDGSLFHYVDCTTSIHIRNYKTQLPE